MTRHPDTPLDLPTIAAENYVSVWTLRDAKRYGRFPAPDGRFATIDYWFPDTVRAWRHGQPPRSRTDRDLPVDIAGVATLLGLSWHTAREYRTSRRLPPPDGVLGRRLQWWYSSTITRWADSRRAPRAG